MPRYFFAIFILLIATALLSACAPGNLPAQKIGKPYTINGENYYPSYDANYDKTGTASWYGPGFHGGYTASGEIYNQNDYTAAHPTLPMPSLVRVTNLENGKSLVIRVNDRGPFAGNRLIDLSKASAQKLGITSLAKVRVQFLEKETQQYLDMVKANNGKIIPMAEYHDRAEALAAYEETPENAQQAQMDEKQNTPTETVGAATVSVVQNDIDGQPQLINEAMAEEQPDSSVGHSASSVVVLNQPIQEAAPAAGDDSAADYVPQKTAAQVTPPLAGNYTIQAGAFSTERNARKLEAKLQPVGDTFVDQIVVGSKTLWRVRVGAFAAPDYADEVLAQVKAYVPDAKVVKK